MRFTNWPALTNALVIFTVTLSSLIPAAIADGPVADVNFLVPQNGATYHAGNLAGISWDYDMNPGFNEESLLGYGCDLYLMNLNYKSNYPLAKGVTLLVSSAPNATALVQPSTISYPLNTKIGDGYFVTLESELTGSWRSGVFSIVSH